LSLTGTFVLLQQHSDGPKAERKSLENQKKAYKIQNKSKYTKKYIRFVYKYVMIRNTDNKNYRNIIIMQWLTTEIDLLPWLSKKWLLHRGWLLCLIAQSDSKQFRSFVGVYSLYVVCWEQFWYSSLTTAGRKNVWNAF